MKIEHERDNDYRRWSIELDDWLMRVLVLAVVMVLVPAAGAVITDALTILAK
jgi:hypothetical protein